MSATPIGGAPFAFALAFAAACSAPLGPPAPDESLQPPRYLAANCSPVSEVARQNDVTTNAFFVDLDEGRSCEIFLEQDECILAIFRDCSYDGRRQWIGSATPGDNGVDVVFTPVFERAPPRTPPRQCTGTFADTADPRTGTRLTCEGEGIQGLYLERKDFSVKRFGERMPNEQLPLGSFGTIDALPAVLPVQVGGTSELWIVVNWSGGGAGGGVYRVKGTGEAPLIEQIEPVGRPRVLGASPGGLVVVGVGHEMLEDTDLNVYDANVLDPRRTKITTTTTADTVFAIAGASGDRFVVASKPRAGTTHGLKLYTYDRPSQRLRASPGTFTADRATTIQAVVWSKPAKADAVPFVVAMTKTGSDDGVVVGLDDDLREVWRTADNRKFDVRAMETLPGRGRVAVILAGGERDFMGPDQSNHYYELDPATGAIDPVVALPFADTQAISYDLARDRVYIAQRFGVLGYVERTPLVRAAQGSFKLDRPNEHTDVVITAMAWDPSRQRMVFADPLRGVLDSVRLTAP